MESDVKLIVNGLKAKLSNGIITVEFDENASVTSLNKNNIELVKNLSGAATDPDKDHSFYVDYHAEGKFRNIKVSKLKVIKNTKDEAHIAYIDTTGLLYIEYNILMKKGESGLYSYVIAKNNTGREFKLSELRTVYRLDSSIFDHAYNWERKGKQPVHCHLCQGKKIQDETYELLDGEEYSNGKIYSKYDYAGYYKDNHFWGQYGNGLGFWFIPVSTEYYPSGPLKQELLVHYNAIILNYMAGAHFGTGDFYIPPNWQKLYGPWYLYINCGNAEEVIRDATVKSSVEEEKWPYDWMNESLYPKFRGAVTGELAITHKRSSEGMMIVLAKPGGNFIRQKADYIFYSQADKKGRFKLNNVRPGIYTLYAYTTQGNITDEFQKDDIVVESEDVNLGEIIWDPPYHKNKLWQIGEANRTAAEFKFGNQLRNYKWHCMVPGDLDYVIGKSKECEDWYYAQTKPGAWNIHFIIKNISVDKFYLTVAIASATKGKIDGVEDPVVIIKVNSHIVRSLSYPSDTTIYRSATQSGWYHLEKIELDSAILHLGENIVSFINNHSAIMYDTILLESD
jgi:rhamnogalacturonan endolyase